MLYNPTACPLLWILTFLHGHLAVFASTERLCNTSYSKQGCTSRQIARHLTQWRAFRPYQYRDLILAQQVAHRLQSLLCAAPRVSPAVHQVETRQQSLVGIHLNEVASLAATTCFLLDDFSSKDTQKSNNSKQLVLRYHCSNKRIYAVRHILITNRDFVAVIDPRPALEFAAGTVKSKTQAPLNQLERG